MRKKKSASLLHRVFVYFALFSFVLFNSSNVVSQSNIATYSAYSFKAWDSPVQIADDKGTLFDVPGFLKVVASNKYIQIAASGFLQLGDQKPSISPFLIQRDMVDGSKMSLFARDLKKYVVLKNLQMIDSDNLYSSTEDSSKISAEETVLNSAIFGRQFIFEAEGSGVKIRNASGSLTTYLRVDADGFVRAFKPDPSRGNRYVAPIAKAEATLFVVEESTFTAAPLNTGDIIAFRFQDGSYLGASEPNGTRRVVFNKNGPMDPATHFKVFQYSDDYKERGIISFATGDYDLASYRGNVHKSVGNDPAVLGLDIVSQSLQSGGPFPIWMVSDPNITRFTLKYDAGASANQRVVLGYDATQPNNRLPAGYQLPAGFTDRKLCRNSNPKDASEQRMYPVLFKNIDASTPESDYKFEIVVLKPYHRLLSGIGAPTTLAAINKDLVDRFKPAFEAPSKQAEDWISLVAIFRAYITDASNVSGFTFPQGAPAQSIRDRAVAMIIAALPAAPASVRSVLQDLQVFLSDIPIYLPDPATPPTLIPGIKLDVQSTGYIRLLFNIADDVYLGQTSNGKLGALKTSKLDPAIQFFARDYSSKNGRISLSQISDFNNVDTASQVSRLAFLRGNQSADGTLSLEYTLTSRGVDISVTAGTPQVVTFMYAGREIAFSRASLGLPAGSPIKTFTPVLLDGALENDACYLNVASIYQRVLSRRPYSDTQLSSDLLILAQTITKNNFSEADWNLFVQYVSSYFLNVPSIAPTWNQQVQKNYVDQIPTRVPWAIENGAGPKTNAEFAERILKRLLGMSNLTTVARQFLQKSQLAFLPLRIGSKIVFKIVPKIQNERVRYLSRETVDGKVVMRPSATSTYNPSSQFEVVNFNPANGLISIKSTGGLFLARDQALGDLIFKGERSDLTFQYDFVSKSIKIGVGDKFAQVDPLSGNIKITADERNGLALEIQEFNPADNLELSTFDKESIETVIVQKLSPLFNVTSTKNPSDWKYLLSILSEYIQQKMVTPDDYIAWGVQRENLNKKSLRDEVVGFITTLTNELQKQMQAAQGPAKDLLIDIVTQSNNLLAKLQDVPVYVDPAAAVLPIEGLANQATVALKVADDTYVIQDSSALKVMKTLPLEPATHVLIAAYDQAKGRAIFKIGEKFLDISSSAPYSFVLKDTPRFVAVRRHETIAKKFLFLVGATAVSFDQAKLGLQASAPVQEFELAGPLSDIQKSFKNVLISMGRVPTPESVRSDIQSCFDPVFAQLGTFSGDWLYYVQKFDAYLQFIESRVRIDSLQLTGVRGGSLMLKDYAQRIFSSFTGPYSSASNDAKTEAAKAFARLSGSPLTQSVSAETFSFSVGDAVFVEALGKDPGSKQKISCSSGKLVKGSHLPVIDRALHFTVAAYDAASQSIVLGFNRLVFDPTTRMFVAKQAKEVQALRMEPVDVAGTVYYYLKNNQGARLAMVGDFVEFNATGDLFDLSKISDGLLLLDVIPAPSNAMDLEQSLSKFVMAFDAMAMDTPSLSYVLAEFDAFCAKAALIGAWGSEKSSAGSTFKEYARLLLTVILKSPSYTGLTPALSLKIAQMLENQIFASTATTVVDSFSSKKIDEALVNSVTGQQTSYRQLDGAKGNLTKDLPIFNDALEQEHESTDELRNILTVLDIYLQAASKRFDWYAQGVAFGGAIPRDYAVAMLQRVLDNTRFFTGLTDELLIAIQKSLKTAKDNAASYSAQLMLLDSYAKEIVSPEGLLPSARLIVLLKNLVADVKSLEATSFRMQLLKKIELYFNRSMIPALRVPRIDIQKHQWELLLFGLQVQLVSIETTSLELLDEKIAAFEQVLIPRLRLLDVGVQLDAILMLLDLVKPIAPALVKLVPDSKNPRFTKFVSTLFTYVDFVVKQNAQDNELSDDQKELLRTIQSNIRDIKIVLGLEANIFTPKLEKPGITSPAVETPMVSVPQPVKKKPSLNLRIVSPLASEYEVPSSVIRPSNQSNYADEFSVTVPGPSTVPSQRQPLQPRLLEI